MRRDGGRSPVDSPTPLPPLAEVEALSHEGGQARATTRWAGDIYLVAQCHLDSAWLWTWRETQRKACSTFERAVGFLRRFDGYSYTQSQAQLYAWVERDAPELFAQVRHYVMAGRWHLAGGMWVEPDTNLLRGESLARQLLYGQRWFQQKFGRLARVGWLIDTFGFSAQLPQLMRQAGLDGFVTTKMLWNDTTEFPHNLFWWEALDGTRVLAYQTPDVLGRKNLVGLLGAVQRFAKRNATPHVMLLYGEGDGGNGPKLDEVLQVQLMAGLARRGLLPRIHQSSPHEYFDRVAHSSGIPTWRGEMYLEYHRGALTTDVVTKAYNRRCEEALLTAETFALLAQPHGLPYPREELRELWQRLMLNQGHDSIAGTVIRDSQQECHAAFRDILAGGQRILQRSLQALAAPGLVVINPLGFPRDEVMAADLPAGLLVQGASVQQRGRDVTGREWVFFRSGEVPPLGFRSFSSSASATPAENTALPRCTAGPLTLETAWCQLTVDRVSGHVTSLRDRRVGGREVLAGAGNVLQLFLDRPRKWDAWNIDPGTLDHPPRLLDKATRVELVESGPLRHVVRTERAWRKSRFVCHIIAWEDTPRLDFELWVDWRETRRLLKVAFPVAVQAERATFEVPFGAVERSTRSDTPQSAAQFEVPLLRWMDLSSSSYGVALLNDGRYAGDVRGNVMRLSLLRAPTYPPRLLPELVAPLLGSKQPIIDHGEHVIRYALIPHAGGWAEAGVVPMAAAFNQPLRAIARSADHEPRTPARSPMASLASWQGPSSVMIESIKMAEDEDACVVRLYEATGQAAAGLLEVAGSIRQAHQCDLLERPQSALDLEPDGVPLQFRPFEIKSLLLRLASLHGE